jgi:hypothetical protein
MILVVAIIIIINRYQQYVRFVRCRHDYILYSEELYLSSLTTIIYIYIYIVFITNGIYCFYSLDMTILFFVVYYDNGNNNYYYNYNNNSYYYYYYFFFS